MKSFFLDGDGLLKSAIINLLTIGSIAMMVVPWFFDIDRMVCYALFCLGAVLGSTAAYSDRFGNKSFTNDPLGWRKAKKSYNKPEETTNTFVETEK